MKWKLDAKAGKYYLILALLMIGLGASDAMRGVFAPVFSEQYALGTYHISRLIMVSYVGNLVFMLLGSRLADQFGLRRIFLLSLLGWIGSQALYLLTDSYLALLLGVFFAMGASTLLNILMNIMSPILFAAPGSVINTLFFIQTIGTTATQGGIGRLADSILVWKMVCLGLLLIGIFSLLGFYQISRRDEAFGVSKESPDRGSADRKMVSPKSGSVYGQILLRPAFWIFVLVFGLYFVAEHGIMNWMNLYARDGLGMAAADAALLPTLFYTGVMLGRLFFAGLVGKLGVKRMNLLFLSMGSIFYLAAFLLGGRGLYLLFAAGLGLSIIYPTMTMCIQLYFQKEVTTTASGTIMSLGTVFDILFNLVFGSFIASWGYQRGMMILPLALLLCLASYLYLYFRIQTVRSLS